MPHPYAPMHAAVTLLTFFGVVALIVVVGGGHGRADAAVGGGGGCGGGILGPVRVIGANMCKHHMLIFGMIAEHFDHVEVGACSQRIIAAWKGVSNRYFAHIHVHGVWGS